MLTYRVSSNWQPAQTLCRYFPAVFGNFYTGMRQVKVTRNLPPPGSDESPLADAELEAKGKWCMLYVMIGVDIVWNMPKYRVDALKHRSIYPKTQYVSKMPRQV